MVAFTSLPLPREVERHKYVCEAYKTTLINQESLPSDTPPSVQMVTFWPIKNKRTSAARQMDCDHLIAAYDLSAALQAIQDADNQREALASRRGPFLIGWSPAKSRFERNAVVLVMDLSRLDSQESIAEVFKAWRQKIIDDPGLWRNGWDLRTVRLVLRDTLDRYGESLVKFIKTD